MSFGLSTVYRVIFTLLHFQTVSPWFFFIKRNIYDFRDLNLPADNMDNRTVTLSCYGPGLSGMLGDVQEDVEMDPPPRGLADGGFDWCWF